MFYQKGFSLWITKVKRFKNKKKNIFNGQCDQRNDSTCIQASMIREK